jgi:hypothetical protein
MFAISSVLLLIVVFLCHGLPTNRECAPDTIDFATKVDKSSVVVYGKAMAKIMNEGSDSTFHVFFQVDCVLKGPATLRQINITNVGKIKISSKKEKSYQGERPLGRAEGKQYCQEFPVGRGYSIAFLEPILSDKTDHKTFTPADFAEILDEGNSTSQLLARTCNLHRLVPRQSLASVTEVCPAVGTDPICLQVVNTTAIVTTKLLINSTMVIVSDATTNISNETLLITNDKKPLSHPIHTPQQEIDAIRGKSGTIQVYADKQNGAHSITFSILLMIMAIFFCSN